MPTNRPVRKLIALVQVAGAFVVVAETGVQAVAARPAAAAVSATTYDQGNPNAVPPILRPARRSELAEMRRVEAQQTAGAGYSNVEMDAFASEGYGGS